VALNYRNCLELLRTSPAPKGCMKTVSKPLLLGAFELQLSEKQMPQVVGFIRSRQNQGERVERASVRPRQVRYQLRYALTLQHVPDETTNLTSCLKGTHDKA